MGGIIYILFCITIGIYFLVGFSDIFGIEPTYTFNTEPIHLDEQKPKFHKNYTAYKDRFHWNFGVGFKGADQFPDFNILNNEYV